MKLSNIAFVATLVSASSVCAQELDAGVGAISAFPSTANMSGALVAAFWSQLFPVLITVLTGLLALVAKQLMAFIDSKTAGTLWVNTISQLEHAIEAVVTEAEVTLKPQFVSSLVDGKLSTEEGAKLKAAVKELILSKAAPELLTSVKQAVGPLFDTVVGGLIEKAVSKI